jgi:hypothetical protein
MKQFVFSAIDCTCKYVVIWKLHEIITLVLTLCIATRYGLDGTGIESEFGVGSEIFTSVQTCPGALSASCMIGTGSFLWGGGGGVKRPRRGDDHQTPLSSEVQESVELYLSSFGCAFVAGYRVSYWCHMSDCSSDVLAVLKFVTPGSCPTWTVP